MRKILRSRKHISVIALILAAVVFMGMLPNLAVPALSANVREEKPAVLMNAEPVTQVTLEENAKLRFEAEGYEDAACQWQILDPRNEDRWVDIADGITGHLWVTYALVGSMLASDDTAQLRCRMEQGGEIVYTDPVLVTVYQQVDEWLYDYVTYETTQVFRRMRAAEPEYTTYSIVINYLFDDNSIAFEPYGASVAGGSSFKVEVPSPEVVGYSPFRREGNAYIDASVVKLDLTDIRENVTINVIYEPALVDYAVHHHLQNVLDDEYSVHSDLITYGKALTGSIVPDGLALTPEQLPGFTSLAYERLPVAADGSTVVEIRYDRNYYLVEFDMGGGYGTDPVYTRCGAMVGANDPIRRGYVFDGWELVSYGGQTPTAEQQAQMAISQQKTIEVPAANLKYKARWITQNTLYTLVFWQENANDPGYSYWGYLERSALSGSYVDAQDLIKQVEGITDSQYFTFNKNKSDKHVLVEGDGSTIVNVYYTRNYYNITFKAPGKCILPEGHTHTDACYEVICGLDEHVHGSGCDRELTCPTPEHTAHTEACVICGKQAHIHGSVGCDCTLEEHSHTTACWNNVGNRTTLRTPPSNPKNGQVYRSGVSRYIYINGDWYKLNNSSGVMSGTVIDPKCNKTDHTHGADCSCDQEEHAHTDSCYRDVLHAHSDDNCYAYKCGLEAHTHDSNCKRLRCKLPNHTHSKNDACNNTGTNNVVKIHRAKYRQSLKDIWPITDDYGKIYDAGQRWDPSGTELYTEVLVYIDEMPGKDFTLTLDVADRKTYTMNYYQEILPGETPKEGETFVTFERRQYRLYKQIKALYNHVTKKEDFFPLRGFTQYKSDPAFGSGSNPTLSPSDLIVDFYYNRITDHDVVFTNINDRVNTVGGIPYGASLKDLKFDPPYPDAEPNSLTFQQWYTSPGCFPGTEVDWNTLTSPEGDLMLYAKWVPITHRVRVFKDRTMTEQIGEDQFVDHKAFATAPSGHLTNGNYVFQGWFYEDVVNGQVVEKAFAFHGFPVVQDLDIYAKWGSHVQVPYKIYYKLLNGEKEIADPTVGTAIAGNNMTFQAKTEGQLYMGYQAGYYPLTSSHTITMSVDGTHEFTFYYVYVESMPYKVRYVNALTGEPLREDKLVLDNELSVVTETFLRFDKMMPDAYQKRLVLSADNKNPDENGIYESNVITFRYSRDEEHAYYRVAHYIQNISGDSYREYRSEESVGEIGSSYTVAALKLTGFAFNGAKTRVNGVLTPIDGEEVTTQLGADGALIELYYDRQTYPYLVRYVDSRTDTDLCDPKTGTAGFGEQVVEYARNLESMGYMLVSENVKTITVSANEDMNVIEFLYQETNVALKYEIVGPEGCGDLTQYGENITAITGSPNGSAPLVKKGFVFFGWFTDPDCTVPVDPAWVEAETNRLMPQKTGNVWSTVTYYAKFGALETELTITTKGTDPADGDQVFIFEIKGKEDTDTAGIDLTVTVVGDGSVTITKLPLGDYTVTEKTDWSWRYEDVTPTELTLTYNEEGNTLIYQNRRENGKWLDGNAVKDNLFPNA